jgi:glycosyltransferase involved in cell wall biosynthesis
VNVSFVIPAHNELENLRTLLEGCHAALAGISGRHEIVIVDDGSSDGTGDLLDELAAADPLLKALHNPVGQNVGCHPAELQAMRAATGEVLMFLPADLQILPSVLPVFLASAGGAEVVASHRARRADAPWRRWLSAANNRIERLAMGVDVHDAHSSMLLTRRAADALLPLIQSRSALIPAELLLRAKLLGLSIAEVEIEHHPRAAGRQTGAKPSEVLKIPVDLIRLRRTVARERSAPHP